MGEKDLADELVRRAVNVAVVSVLIEFDPVRREDALERREVLGVAVDERPVEVEEQRRRHIVAPICQGVNSDSP